MERTEARALAQAAVDAALAAGADGAEAIVDASSTLGVSLANNDLEQVKVADETILGLRILRDGRMGFATTNRPAEVAALVEEAVAIGKASPVDDLATLPDAAPVPEAEDVLDEALLAVDASALAQIASTWLDRLRDMDSRVSIDSGDFTVERSTRAIASSTGVDVAWRSAAASGGVFGMAVTPEGPGSFSYDGDVVRRLSELDGAVELSFRRFVDACIGALDPQQGQSFRGPILVPPRALDSFLIGPLMGALSGKNVRLGRSPLADKAGERIASARFTLRDRGAGLDHFALAPFDREGQPRRARVLVDAGVLGGFVYDSREGRAAGAGSTGSAAGGASGPPRIGVASLSIDPGERTSQEMIQGLERGVIVTRFAGTTNPVSGDFSGVVKGGFLVEKGALTPIHETTIAGNVWRCLESISALSSDTTPLDGTRRYPWVRVEDLSITAA